MYRHEGYLPGCRISLCKSFIQGGRNAEIPFSDFHVKNILNPSIDWPSAYEAVLKDANEEQRIWLVEGRGGMMSWNNLGYIPADNYDPLGVGPFTRSISRTVEYAYDAFCVSRLPQAPEVNGSGNVSNPANGTIETGSTGHLQRRYSNGTFGFENPIFCLPLLNFTFCYFFNLDGHETYEGSIWLYTFFAPHDMANLIAVMGGDDEFVARLRYFHETPNLLYVGDEQAFLTVHLYHFAGRPGLLAQKTHQYIPSQFKATLVGIPGNDESGAIGSFAAISMVGIFPNPGQDVYFITPPFFEEVSIRNKLTGNIATINSRNFDGGTGFIENGTAIAGYQNIYIQNATMNGSPYSKNWLSHSFF